jgi:hypothetical protein
MIIQGDTSEYDIDGIDEVELQHLGTQLINYVTTYRKLIRIDQPEVERKLNILYDIGIKIINHQYHMLFNDPSIVIPNVKQMTLSEYQSELYEAYICGTALPG